MDEANIEMIVPDHSAAMVREVLLGEYDLDYNHPAPVVLDIGANVGAFAVWALHRWPGAVVHCYEPLPDNFAMLQANVAHLGDRVVPHNVAIGDPTHTKLFLGQNNCGEGSFFQLGEQRDDYVEVVTQPASVLPPADIVKIDTEGSEVEILSRLERIEFDVVLLEYHSDALRRAVDQLLADYVLMGAAVHSYQRGVLKYVHRRLIDAATSA